VDDYVLLGQNPLWPKHFSLKMWELQTVLWQRQGEAQSKARTAWEPVLAPKW